MLKVWLYQLSWCCTHILIPSKDNQRRNKILLQQYITILITEWKMSPGNEWYGRQV